ncbi:phosphodiesterase [Microbacterium sp. 77mftsu3.1]|uniref:phosphodiesterase n=1 Tax=Microbacterium sp. 77mftsu3.1 TaxID=1761802 RepID=UPI00037DB134|nr:phosphodiesterase [Microbacterium sp. 77mftsu3.1]SDH40222.1 Calcineurin-like phosphoesterase [Microbacterium sp. 77mftsu3.1]
MSPDDETAHRYAEYPPASRVLLHLSDTHLRAPGPRAFESVDPAVNLARALDAIEASGIRPDGIVFTGDLTDLGEADAYVQLRGMVEPFAASLGAPVHWVMGNHDDREGLRNHLLYETADPTAPVDRVDDIDGLRLITLDTSVPGHHHGELSDDQLVWVTDVLRTSAPFGTILAMHHPPVPSVLPLAATVELRDQRRLAAVLRSSDVRAIIAGHLHYSTFATFAGIPVSVASSTCYAQDLTVPVGGTRPMDAGQGYNLVHVYADTIVHSVVPLAATPTLEHTDAREAQRRLEVAGILAAPRTR